VSTTVSEPSRRRDAPRAALWGRLLVAHLLCYPLLFAVALASMSLAIIRYHDRLLAVTAADGAASAFQRWLARELGLALADAARFEIVVRPVGVALGVVFVLVHLGSVPWALAAAREVRSRGTPDAEVARARLRRARRWWLGSSLGLAALLVLVGLGGWVWIFTR
jgi:hypothetical protein